jgi:hypothetical protein
MNRLVLGFGLAACLGLFAFFFPTAPARAAGEVPTCPDCKVTRVVTRGGYQYRVTGTINPRGYYRLDSSVAPVVTQISHGSPGTVLWGRQGTLLSTTGGYTTAPTFTVVGQGSRIANPGLTGVVVRFKFPESGTPLDFTFVVGTP